MTDTDKIIYDWIMSGECEKRLPDLVVESIESIDLSDSLLDRLPSAIKAFKNLKCLNIGISQETDNKQFHFICLAKNRIKKLPIDIGELKNLQQLNISGTQIKVLPSDIGMLTNLQLLNIGVTQISVLPSDIGKLTNLRQLDIRNTQISVLPSDIGKLTNLRQLDIRNTQIKELPSDIGKLTNLQQLDIRNTQISELPSDIGKFTNLQQLYISGTQIKELPSVIWKLTNLQKLDISGTQIKVLSSDIGLLTNLQKLDISGTQIKVLPSDIGMLTNLQKLDISGTQIKVLPSDIGLLTNLQKLDVRGTQIKELPSDIGLLTSLQLLDIGSTQIKELPSDIGLLTSLQLLDIRSTQIKELPSDIGLLTSLQLLDISSTQISVLSSDIGLLTNLHQLDISGTQISVLSSDIGLLTNLQQLDISGTQISELPSDIGKLTNLRQLDIGSTQIKELPSDIGTLTNLQLLDISGTEISELPSDIGRLTNLRQLDIGSTQIKELPSDIGKLTNLRQLDIRNTQIKELPESIYNLKHRSMLNLDYCKLTYLPRKFLKLGPNFYFENNYLFDGVNLSNTTIEQMDINIFRRPRKEIEAYYDLLEKDMQFLNEARVIFVGDGGSGKSTILKHIETREFKPTEVTPGISILKHPLQIAEEDVSVTFWDFGGQEVMHSTHRFFLNDNCIYVLVLDGQKQERPEYWLDFIRRYSKNAKVMVAVNKCDFKDWNILNKKGLRRQFPELLEEDFPVYPLSCKTGRGFEEFLNGLKEVIKSANTYKKRWPGPWVHVRRKIEELQETENYLSEKEYKSFCRENGIEDEKQQSFLLDYLKSLGIVFHYEPLTESHRMVKAEKVLKPDWITNGIYKVINAKELENYNGYIPISKVEAVLKSRTGVFPNLIYENTEETEFIRQLLQDFHMAYEHAGKLFIPAMCDPDEKVDIANWMEEGVCFRYRFRKGMPLSVFYQLLIRFAEEVDKEKTWKTGSILTNSMFHTETLLYAENELLNIQIRGGDIPATMQSIRYAIYKELKGISIPYTEELGVQCGKEWYYCPVDRLIHILLNGGTQDFITGIDQYVNIYEILKSILPEKSIRVLQKRIGFEAEKLKEEKDPKEKLRRQERMDYFFGCGDMVEGIMEEVRSMKQFFENKMDEQSKQIVALLENIKYRVVEDNDSIVVAIAEVKDALEEAGKPGWRDTLDMPSAVLGILQGISWMASRY